MNVKPRLILNDDASNFIYSRDNLTAADLRAYLARYAGTQVDTVAYCVAFGGGLCFYNSEIAERLGTGFLVSDKFKTHRVADNLRRLADEAGDYIGLVFATLKQLGLPALASFRMNDAHMSSDPTGYMAGRFWQDHPQWRLDPSYKYYASCMNYEVPAVRAFLRALVNEVVEKFPDIAGVELDAMRSPFFFNPGQGPAGAPLLTELIGQIRDDLDTAASKRHGERYLLNVNVPRSPELALECGLDVAEWRRRGLVDVVSVGSYDPEMQLPIEAWRAQLGDDTHLMAYLNCSPQTAVYLSRPQYRAAAANAYGAGADGITLFNVPCSDELCGMVPRPMDEPLIPLPAFRGVCWHPDIQDCWKVLHELGSPEALEGKDKHYLFYVQEKEYRHKAPGPIRLARLAGGSAEVPFRLYEDASGASTLELRVKTAGVSVNDAFDFALNGRPIDGAVIERTHAHRGRDARIHPVPLEPYSQFKIPLEAVGLRRGENVLKLELVRSERNLFTPIRICELEIVVNYAGVGNEEK